MSPIYEILAKEEAILLWLKCKMIYPKEERTTFVQEYQMGFGKGFISTATLFGGDSLR